MSIVLIHSPGFRLDELCVAASKVDRRLVTTCYWEQISDVSFSSDGQNQIRFRGIAADKVDLIIFAGYPNFAIVPDIGLSVDFVTAEWTAILHTFLHSPFGNLTNRRAFERYLLYVGTTSFLLPALQNLGWRVSRDRGRQSNHGYLALARWKTTGSSDSSSMQGNFEDLFDRDMVARTHILLQRLGIDVLFLRILMTAAGPAVTDASLLPPEDLTSRSWFGVLDALLP